MVDIPKAELVEKIQARTGWTGTGPIIDGEVVSTETTGPGEPIRELPGGDEPTS